MVLKYTISKMVYVISNSIIAFAKSHLRLLPSVEVT
jgi:hypothetical protein